MCHRFSISTETSSNFCLHAWVRCTSRRYRSKRWYIHACILCAFFWCNTVLSWRDRISLAPDPSVLTGWQNLRLHWHQVPQISFLVYQIVNSCIRWSFRFLRVKHCENTMRDHNQIFWANFEMYDPESPLVRSLQTLKLSNNQYEHALHSVFMLSSRHYTRVFLCSIRWTTLKHDLS